MSKPKSKMLMLSGSLAKNALGSFLEPKDLCAVALTCKQNSDTYKTRCKASELLFYGLNINKTRKEKIRVLLDSQNIPRKNLSKDKKYNKVNLPPASFWQMLLFNLNLSRTLHPELPQHTVSPELPQQFVSRENLSQNSPNSVSQYASSVILTRVNGRQVYFSKEKNATVSIRILANMSPLEAAALSGDFPLVRLLLDNLPDNQNQDAVLQLRGIRAKLESDPRSFVALINNLQRAYQELIDNYNTLANAENWVEVDILLGFVGENQKNLPWFILQVYCNPVPHEPLPDFTQEPNRDCLLFNNKVLNLDSIGKITQYAIVKGSFGDSRSIVRVSNGHWGGHMMRAKEETGIDSLALNKLRAVIKSELDQIIKLLEQKLLLAEYPNPEQSHSTSALSL